MLIFSVPVTHGLVAAPLLEQGRIPLKHSKLAVRKEIRYTECLGNKNYNNNNNNNNNNNSYSDKLSSSLDPVYDLLLLHKISPYWLTNVYSGALRTRRSPSPADLKVILVVDDNA